MVKPLTKKLLRDFNNAKLQLISMMLLCALGTWVFSGLDAAWRLLDRSAETYYAQQNLADFWIQLPDANRDTLRRIAHLDGVEDAHLRVKLQLDTDLDNDATLLTYGYDEPARINIPYLYEGALLSGQDNRGCMLDVSFARANALSVGDTLTLRQDDYGFRKTFTIRALIASPEQVLTSKEVAPDPNTYGFVLVNSEALFPIPSNEITLTLAEGAVPEDVQSAIEGLYPYALVIAPIANTAVQFIRDHIVMFRNLSYVFPLLAFAVAAMIVLTTITRMIENQRTQMGTLKALGYRSGQIRMHYLGYALYPSLLGSLLGLWAGRVTLPQVLWNMEENHILLPLKLSAPISAQAWFVCVLAVLLACYVCLRVYRKAGKESPASLLRPKPSKAGQRNLVERIPGLWKRFGFNTKMVVRNMFRNKLRTGMTLVGVLCCNMLLIMTFGIQDSINYFVGKYYSGTVQYDIRVDLSNRDGTLDAYRGRLDADYVDGLMLKSASLHSSTVQRTGVLNILCDDQRSYHLGDDFSFVPLPKDGIAITQKLMNTLGVQIGDTLTVYLAGDDEKLELPITQMYYSNIGQGVYLSQSYWESLRKGAFIPDSLLIHAPSEACLHRIDNMDEALDVLYPEVQRVQNLKILDSVTTIFMVLAGAALALAFVITYNMGILNFSERTREYATLKVLGYHQKEIKHLMLRESNLVALLGTLLGILPGILLIGVVMKSCETEQTFYGLYVTLKSILLASGITFGFTRLIQEFLTRKVHTIDMVESLKSVE